MTAHAHGAHASGHQHGVSAGADRRFLVGALVLIVGFMVVELVVGLVAGSLALISDAGHMLTDAASILLALVAMRLAARPARGAFTFGLKRAEILSAQANGLTLALLVVLFVYEGVRRLVDPPAVEGGLVAVTAGVGIVVNAGASWLLSRADRSRLNVEGAFQHIVNDLFAFVATFVAGLVVLLTGFARADAIAALVVAALMAKAAAGLLRDSWRIFLEAAPKGLEPVVVEQALREVDGVCGVHDLHVWEVTSGFPALSAHVLVDSSVDCHARRLDLERMLDEDFGIDHTTLQVDHVDDVVPPEALRRRLHPERGVGTTHPGHEEVPHVPPH